MQAAPSLPICLAHRQQRATAARQSDAAALHRLGIGLAEGTTDTHDLAGRLHLRSQQGVDAGEFHERKHGLFHIVVPGHDLAGNALVAQGAAHHTARADLGQRLSGRLGDEGYGTRGTRIDLEQIDVLALDRKLGVHESDHLERMGEAAHLLAHAVLDRGAQRIGRQ
mgnify:CR=1 FL=1